MKRLRYRLKIPKEYKQRLVGKRGFWCERCHETIFQHIHHVDCDPSNNDEHNLRLLCNECHIITHLQLFKKKDKRFNAYLLPRHERSYYFELIKKKSLNYRWYKI